MIITINIDDETIEEVRTSLSRYSDGPASDALVKAFLEHEAKAGVAFSTEEGLDENVDHFVRK